MKTLALTFSALAVTATTAVAGADIKTFDANNDRFASFAETTAVFPNFSSNDFRTIDVNRDNRLSAVEIQAADAQATLNRYLASSDVVDLASVDTDGDNFVSFFELAGAYPGLSANDWRDIGGHDGNRLNAGAFYADETRVVLDRSGLAGEAPVSLSAVDTDGSRFASFGELSAAFPGLSALDFDDIDLNDDNRVSFDELYAIDSRTILSRAAR